MAIETSVYPNTILEVLGIVIQEVLPDKITATMPVNNATLQPFGLLHGGASVVLAESVASLGAYNLIDQSTHYAVGLEINANHIRSKREGMVTAVGVPLHKGRTTMVWEIKILDEEHKLICISRCTIGIIPINK